MRDAGAPPETPAIAEAAKPWTRWWWPGSAVDEAGIDRQLDLFARAGLGGVEITPIYGARSAESREVPFLSPRWIALLAHAAREAHRRGLRVDMATGTGWPFGGPWVTAAEAEEKPVLQDGRLTGRPTGMRVKRAAPGGEGLVIDPYSTAALEKYLAPFSAALAPLPRGSIRAQFHDSFEYFGAGWSPLLPQRFRELRGYDLQDHARELLAPAGEADQARLKADYRATLAQMHLDWLRAWVAWSHEHGFLARDQAHGAPGNLLDLYGAVDIPETEVFGATPFPIAGLRPGPAAESTDNSLPEPLMMRFASSAAHVNGHPLASSETGTWLREHWQASLADLKPEIDRLFVNGINHIVYHGTVYSPADAAWPGWLFYASTEFYPTNPWWRDFPALNAYVTRVQSVLQSGQPDNDTLVYWPFEDVTDDPDGLVLQLAVQKVGWLTRSPYGMLARRLAGRGFSFDSLSDAQLTALRTEAGALVVPGGGKYRLLVVPATRRMPLPTLRRLVAIARVAPAVWIQEMPEDVPGLGQLPERRREFQSLCAELRQVAAGRPENVRIGPRDEIGDGGFVCAHASREDLADSGLGFIRRATSAGTDYFIANQTAHEIRGWFAPTRANHAWQVTDPLTGRSGAPALRRAPDGAAEVYLQIASGDSLLLRGSSDRPTEPAWRYAFSSGPPVRLSGTWQIEFVEGGPGLPPALATAELKSWTDLGGKEARRFAGTGRYRLVFQFARKDAGEWLLDLGDVRESARVRLNRHDLGASWSVPHVLRVTEALRDGENLLEIDVTNLAANRIRDLDQRHVPWKIMKEINFVNLRYRPFDASDWPLTPSGLLGPVTLTPVGSEIPR